LNEARAIGSEVHAHELAGRTDCRGDQVVTIDPDDAKDFDDAICLQRASPDSWKLWVHIADVSNYVKPGTALDDEARRRGNSHYLVDRRDSNAARSAEQRTVLAQAKRGSADEVRGVPRFERRPRAENEVLFRRHSFEAPL